MYNTTRYVYNDNQQVLAEYAYDSAGGTHDFLRYYAYGPYIDEVVLMHGNTSNFTGDGYFAHDHLYSVRAVLAGGTGPEERATYDAYGYPDMRLFADFNSDRIVEWADFGIHSASWQLSEDDPSYNWIVEYNGDGFIDWADYGAFASQWQYTVPPDEFSRSGNSYGFTARRTDRIGEYELEEEDSPGSGTYTWNLTGEAFFLQYNRARYYLPQYGRWIARDPAGYVDGMNLYEYVRSRPYVATDPKGTQSKHPARICCEANKKYGFCIQRGPKRPDRCGNCPKGWSKISFKKCNCRQNAPDVYAKASQESSNTGLPGSHNGPQDAFRHCLASCMLARENGKTCARLAGWWNETTHPNLDDERDMDDHNNAEGRSCSDICSMSCNYCCWNRLYNGMLIILPPHRW